MKQCSLSQHAAAEVLQLRSGDASLGKCGSGSAMDAAPSGTAFMNLVQYGKGASEASRRVIWVAGFPRSSTSTVLSMVSAGQTSFTEGAENTYSLFEPCHDGDQYDPDLMNLTRDGCGPVLWNLARCEFAGVKTFWGWADSHSTKENGQVLDADKAGRFCKEADLVTFKTVDYGHRLREWDWLIEQTPEMHVLDVVRDPRGIYASWKMLEPFKTLVQQGQFYSLLDICESFADNLDFNHPRVHHVVFEELVQQPKDTMTKAYQLIGLPFGDRGQAWLNKTFDAQECPEPKPWEVGYTDCHTDSKSVADKWRTVLSEEELDAFNTNPACQKVIEHYGYPH